MPLTRTPSSRKFLIVQRQSDSWDTYVTLFPEVRSKLKVAKVLGSDPYKKTLILRFIREQRLSALSKKLKPFVTSCEIYEKDHRIDNGKKNRQEWSSIEEN